MLVFITIITVAHIASGSIAVVMGAITLAARKGAQRHINGGRVFTLCMGLSSLLGAALGLFKFETFYITFHAGILGVTLVLNGWLLAKLQTGQRKAAFAVVGSVNFLNTAGLIGAGFYALSLPEQVLHEFATADYFFLAAIAGVAFINDVLILLTKTLSDRHRIAQHLWRMCVGFFIAAGSAFTGPGAGIFPEVMRESGILSLPELTIILLMLFWLFRILFGKGRRPILSRT